MENNTPPNPIVHAIGPVMRLIGHSAAAVIGFTAIAIMALIPIIVVYIIKALGAEDLVTPLHYIEEMMLFADVLLFGVIFVNGIVVFLFETVLSGRREIRKLLKDDKNEIP